MICQSNRHDLRHSVTEVARLLDHQTCVDMTNPGYFAISWAEQAYKDGLIASCGTSGGKPKFCPRNLVSRGLVAQMIVRAKNLSIP